MHKKFKSTEIILKYFETELLGYATLIVGNLHQQFHFQIITK